MLAHLFRNIAAVVALTFLTPAFAASLGAFSTVSDVGTVGRATKASFDKARRTYSISASGDNMWAQRDAFGFLWKRVSGDIALSATIEILGTSAQGHRKAGLMFRQSLAPDAAYVDVVVHGDGLTSLQFRSDPGGPTREVQCALKAPTRVRLEKRGDYAMLSLAGSEGLLASSGCSIRVALRGSFLAGLLVCAHDNAAFETAKFTRVEIGVAPDSPPTATNAIELLPLGSLDRKVLYHSTERLTSPRFTPDGTALCFQSNGRLMRMPLDHAEPAMAVEKKGERECAPAVVEIPATWRELSTRDTYSNWYPQVSVDGRMLVFISGMGAVRGGDPPEGDYLLRQMPVAGGEARELARFHGGPGSMDVPPMSPDGRSLVFVSRVPQR